MKGSTDFSSTAHSQKTREKSLYLINDQSNLNLSIGFTNVDQNYFSNFNQTLDDGRIKLFDDDHFNNDVDFSF